MTYQQFKSGFYEYCNIHNVSFPVTQYEFADLIEEYQENKKICFPQFALNLYKEETV